MIYEIIEAIDEQERLMRTPKYSLGGNSGKHISHGYSIKYCMNLMEDEPLEDLRKPQHGLDYLL